MKKIILKIYNRVQDRILDYRYKVPKNAGMCFAYYLIMAVIPTCSLFAFFASLLNLDLVMLKTFLEKFLTPKFSAVIIASLQPNRITLSSFIMICVSLFVVSRGINQLYDISKNLFPAAHNRNPLVAQIIVIAKTLVVFILLILIIALLTIIPILNTFINLSDFFLLEQIYLFFVFFVILFLFYKIIPDAHVHIFDIVKGASCASILMVILLAILQFYFSFADYSTLYGPLASVVVILIAFTMTAEMIYIGMYVMFEEHMKRLIKQMKKEMEDHKKNDKN